MKLDDRDIVCETDYSPLSNAELVAHIQLYADLMHNTPLSDGEWLDDIIGPARVLMARAEAAEAEAARLKEAGRMVQEEVTAWRDSYEALNEQRLALAARVAELAAQSAQSAQGWRDFTERPPIGEQIQIATVIDAVREEPDGLYRIGNTSEWQAWRPAPQEPTP